MIVSTRGTRKRGSKPPTERQKRRAMVLAMLEDLRPPPHIFKAVCAEHGVTAMTVRRDMEWACELVNKDMESAATAEPVRVYWHLDRLAEFCTAAGAATPVLGRDGLPLMGRDPDTGEQFPVMEADAPLLSVALKARQAQVAILGYRDSVKWKRSLAHQQAKLTETKIELAKEQLRVAERERRIDEERRDALASKRTSGGMLLLQKPSEKLMRRMQLFLTMERASLDEYVYELNGGRDGTDDGEDGLPGPGGEPPGEPGAGSGGNGSGGDEGGPGGNGRPH